MSKPNLSCAATFSRALAIVAVGHAVVGSYLLQATMVILVVSSEGIQIALLSLNALF